VCTSPRAFQTQTLWRSSSARWRAAERRQPAGRERMGSPTLQTRQEPILLLPSLCFLAAFQTLTLNWANHGRDGQSTCTTMNNPVRCSCRQLLQQPSSPNRWFRTACMGPPPGAVACGVLYSTVPVDSSRTPSTTAHAVYGGPADSSRCCNTASNAAAVSAHTPATQRKTTSSFGAAPRK
jgi:hypothetical protein